MTSWHSYPSIYNVGHRATADLLSGPCFIEEKVDGSQFSFGVIDGVLRCRSKNVELRLDDAQSVGMFALAVDTVKRLRAEELLRPGWTYRGEFLAKPRHNGLAYARVPRCNVILFDVMPEEEVYLDHISKDLEAERLGLECVPTIAPTDNRSYDEASLNRLLQRESVLGGQLIEGVVIKPARGRLVFGADKKTILAKYVRPEFVEIQKKQWRQDNPTSGDAVTDIIAEYATPARWAKAVQHLRDDGKLDQSPRDIGPLLVEVWDDIVRESLGDIKSALFDAFKKQIRSGVTKGVPEWYKRQLIPQAEE